MLNNNTKPKILLVEDDLNFGVLLAEYLDMEGFEVKLCRDGVSAWKAYESSTYHLCLLDIMLPLVDGFTLAQQIKKENSWQSIIFITSKGIKEDKIQGFKIGADDYITKPFDEEELTCRIKAVLKRCEASPASPSNEALFYIGKYLFNYSLQSLETENFVKRLTTKECEILKILCLNQGKIVRRDYLLNTIWLAEDYFTGRSLDVFITKLRKYLKEDSAIEIETVHSIGFILKLKSEMY